MTAEAWLVKDAAGELVTAYWEPVWAEEYLEDHPCEGLSIERIEYVP